MTVATQDTLAPLQQLARLHGIESSYRNALGIMQDASPDTLLRVLQILKAPLHRVDDAPSALRERNHALWQQVLEPVVIAWDERAFDIPLRLPDEHAASTAQCDLRLEDGQKMTWGANLGKQKLRDSRNIEGKTYIQTSLCLPERIPLGYHQLTVELKGQAHSSLLISAPRRAYAPSSDQKTWGVFLPLYALHTRQSWGSGTLSDLGRLMEWVHGQGGGVVGTLPLTAAFLDEPFECSPYSSASRLFWNEFYLDVQAIPELANHPAAQSLLGSIEFQAALRDLRASSQVDYRREMALKRKVLNELSRSFFAETSQRRGEFERWLASRPNAEDYARFRAVGERLHSAWQEWPTPLRDGIIAAGDYDEDVWRYHLYVQWLADEQLGALAAKARQGGSGLYLDLPLGVNGASYDIWREREAFAVEASGGCPPDVVFQCGQDWGFPPLAPEGIRAQGYRYVISYLKRQLAYAGILRIDHMPVFHRLWWVPRGMEAKEGVYVRYPAEEMYAIFNLESHRHRAMLVGEDLGTVLPEVPESMAKHNVQRMYVVQYALTPDPKAALPLVPPASVASVNNHDMPPFKAYWEGSDIDQRRQLGLLGDSDPDREKEQRQAMLDALVAFLREKGFQMDAADFGSVLRACLDYLAASGPRVTLVSLEDLWEETRPQNIPSTGDECGNWRRKARYSLEEIEMLPAVQEVLQRLNNQVKQGGA